MLHEDGTWYMFFEVMNADRETGEIGLATSRDALSWKYARIVLSEPFHLSYPYVFRWEGRHYMVPETLGADCIRLYQARRFPTDWTPVADLVGGAFADPSLFRFRGRWWMFACDRPYRHDSLRLYHARELRGPWREHPCNPLVENDPCKARPAGRVGRSSLGLVRFGQVCSPDYGMAVRAFRIDELTLRSYRETEILAGPVLSAAGGEAWNALGMHHVDAHRTAPGRWIACVDGFRTA